VNDQAIVSMAAGAGQAVGMQPVDELGIAGLFIHQVGDREIHGRLRMGAMWVVSPKYPPPAPGCKPPTPLGLHEPLVFDNPKPETLLTQLFADKRLAESGGGLNVSQRSPQGEYLAQPPVFQGFLGLVEIAQNDCSWNG
jgi:hypothetical protein